MARRGSSSPGVAGLVGALLVVGLVAVVIKWLLITAAIVGVPFVIWFLWDRHQQERNAPLPLVTDAEQQNTQEKLDAAKRASEEYRLMLAAREAGDTAGAALRETSWDYYRALSRVDRDGLPKR